MVIHIILIFSINLQMSYDVSISFWYKLVMLHASDIILISVISLIMNVLMQDYIVTKML